jgi:hypothetical protein
METFNFVDLYAFLQTALGMILSFLAGRLSMKRKKKAAPPGELTPKSWTVKLNKLKRH